MLQAGQQWTVGSVKWQHDASASQSWPRLNQCRYHSLLSLSWCRSSRPSWPSLNQGHSSQLAESQLMSFITTISVGRQIGRSQVYRHGRSQLYRHGRSQVYRHGRSSGLLVVFQHLLVASGHGPWPSWPASDAGAHGSSSWFWVLCPYLAGRTGLLRVSRSHPRRLVQGKEGLPMASANGGGP